MQQFKDTRFKNRLKDAIHDFYIYRHSKGLDMFAIHQNRTKQLLYETDMFSMHHVPDFVDIRYGVHFKDTDEFGLYGMFVYDESDEEPFKYFSRSNAGFDKETCLDDIRIDEPV